MRMSEFAQILIAQSLVVKKMSIIKDRTIQGRP